MEWPEVSERVVQYVNNKLLLAKANQRLSEAEITILRAAWNKLTYDEIAQETGYTASYIQSGLANNLWKLLTDVIGDGENITKSKFRYFMEWKLSAGADLIPPEGSIKGNAVLIGEPPAVMSFYGRKTELQELRSAVEQNKVVVLSGISGIGKTALAAQLLENIKSKSEGGFDFLIWKSIYYGPSPGNLVAELLKLFPQIQREPGESDSEEFRMTKLISYLRSNRILLVLDEAELFFKKEGYQLFLRRIIEDQHDSCVLLTSRELFKDMAQLGASSRSIQSIKLKGLAVDDALEIVKARGLSVTPKWGQLIDLYQGIPSVIDMVASQVQRLFGGNVEEFFSYKTSLMGDYIQKVLGRELGENDALSSLKLEILNYLCQHNEKASLIGFQELLKGLIKTKDFSILDFKKALEGLAASSIIEVQTDSKTREEKYHVNSLVMKYAMRGRLTPTPTQPI
ncbi:NB-ARC domain-containing protein [Acaryochloris marina NIES-2412]|uniref:NB-ARC domain-containing protein n=1 Tax=Acaryochloris marina TaxID=155978 RepID=UPI004059CFB0